MAGKRWRGSRRKGVDVRAARPRGLPGVGTPRHMGTVGVGRACQAGPRPPVYAACAGPASARGAHWIRRARAPAARLEGSSCGRPSSAVPPSGAVSVGAVVSHVRRQRSGPHPVASPVVLVGGVSAGQRTSTELVTSSRRVCCSLVIAGTGGLFSSCGLRPGTLDGRRISGKHEQGGQRPRGRAGRFTVRTLCTYTLTVLLKRPCPGASNRPASAIVVPMRSRRRGSGTRRPSSSAQRTEGVFTPIGNPELFRVHFARPFR